MARGPRTGGRDSKPVRKPAPPARKAPAVPDGPDVLIVGSEAQPFAKTGGLADVLGALPSALARAGWKATVVLPKYRDVDSSRGGTLVERFPVTIGAFSREVRFYDAPLADGARALLVDCPDLFHRDELYAAHGVDYPDNARRFAMLARAALEFAGRQRRGPRIVHAHDWQAGLVPVYLKSLYASHPVLAETPTVFTIHNLAYQGLFEADWVPRLDLGWEQLGIERMEYWSRISFMKGGINDADVITTVSPRYAEEIQTPELGFGFDGIIGRRSADLVGILNGIDTREWDPSADRFLPAPYSADDFSGKAAAKKALLGRFGLDSESAMRRPIIGMVSRMTDQKGLDLIAALADDLVNLNASFIVLGTGDAKYQDMWTRLAVLNPEKVGARIGFDEELAHLIEAGADMFLMPSQFEPCGLNQMYSMRYGTVPIVHAVGGLADTVSDYAPKRQKATGFVFDDYSPGALMLALIRALTLFKDEKKWRALQVNGMRQDFSWDRSAAEYVKIYERLLKARWRVARV